MVQLIPEDLVMEYEMEGEVKDSECFVEYLEIESTLRYLRYLRYKEVQ